ncbi:T cell receptor alpha chain MC.7.G5 [Tachysurus ichikawai]
MIFASGTKLVIHAKEKTKPEYYKVKQKNDTTIQESCLATRFTVHNDTDQKWSPSGVHKARAVRFEGEGYYSRLMLNDVSSCDETESNCGIKTEDAITFQSDAKTNFLALTIFWLRVLFFKTIAFNILMTVKVWLN